MCTIHKCLMLSVASAFFTLSACGGGGSGSGPTDPPPPPPPPTNSDPTVTITKPSNNQTVSALFAVETDAKDSDGSVVRAELMIDGSSYNVVTTPPFNFSVDPSGYANGQHLLMVKVVDDDNGEGSAQVMVMVDNAPAPVDTDGDGLLDPFELTLGTDPLNWDTDGDTLGDGVEYNGPTDPLLADTDGDGHDDAKDVFPTDPNEWGDYDGDGIGDNADPDLVFHWIELSEYAVYNDELGTKTIRVTARITGVGVDHVKVSLYRPELGLLNVEVEVRDDGQNGDQTAGDFLYSRDLQLSVAPFAVLRSYNGQADGIIPLISIEDSAGLPVQIAYATQPFMTLGVVDRNAAVTAVMRTPDIWTTDAMALVIDPEVDSIGNPATEEATALFCAQFPGVVFDFLTIQNYHRSTRTPLNTRAYSTVIKNHIQGLGLPTDRDESALYGCPDLQLISYFTVGAGNGHAVPHELGHRYSVYWYDDQLDLNYTGENGWPNPTKDGHWGHSTLCGGQMFVALCLEDQGNGTFSPTPLAVGYQYGQYNNWELYAWGLVPRSVLQPQRFVTVPGTFVGYRIPLPVSDTQLVSIDDVVAVYGDRIPAQGQTLYRIGCIAISDEVLSEAEFAYESMKCRYFGEDHPGIPDLAPPSMQYATGGRATFLTLLP